MPWTCPLFVNILLIIRSKRGAVIGIGEEGQVGLLDVDDGVFSSFDRHSDEAVLSGLSSSRLSRL